MFDFDAVLVLGKALGEDPERARRELKARTAAAAAALRTGAGLALTLETRHRRQRQAGSEIVAGYLQELGVPAERLLTRSRASSTRDEARLADQLSRVRGLRRVLAVTGSYHLPRARRIFMQVMGPERVALHAPSALLAYATPREREWILAGEPDDEALRREALIETLWSSAERALRPVPQRLRWDLESRAARMLRG